MEIILRPWRATDAEPAARLANNPRIAQNLRDMFPHPYALEDAHRFIAACLAADEEKDLFRVIEIDGSFAGSISLSRGTDVYQRSAELGYWLGESYWGKGIMTRAVADICRMGFVQWDIVRIFALPYGRNAASRRVLEKAGFALEGTMRQGVYKNGEILDFCMYALLRSDL